MLTVGKVYNGIWNAGAIPTGTGEANMTIAGPGAAQVQMIWA